MACLRLDKYEQAEEDCSRALELKPDYVKALSRRGMARHKRGRYKDAISDFEAALSAQPGRKS